MNTLTITSDDLAIVHHDTLLTAILEEVQTANPFQAVTITVKGTTSTHLFLDVDAMAKSLARDKASTMTRFVEKR